MTPNCKIGRMCRPPWAAQGSAQSPSIHPYSTGMAASPDLDFVVCTSKSAALWLEILHDLGLRLFLHVTFWALALPAGLRDVVYVAAEGNLYSLC